MTPKPPTDAAARYCCPVCRGPVRLHLDWINGRQIPRLECRAGPGCQYVPRFGRVPNPGDRPRAS